MKKAANEWLKFARFDLLTIESIAKSIFVSQSITFHAQQAVEKSIKAYLVANNKRFPKTHDIGKLLDIIREVDVDLSKKLRHLEILTEYAISFRYPEAAKSKITKAKALRAIKIAIDANSQIKKAISDL